MLVQTLVLAPGRIRLTVDRPALGDDGQANAMSGFDWTLVCRAGQRLDPLERVERTAGRTLTAAVDFVVPAGGCTAQDLALIARPERAGETRSLLIDRVSLDRVAG